MRWSRRLRRRYGGRDVDVPSKQQSVRPSLCFVSDVHDVDIPQRCLLFAVARPLVFDSDHYRTEFVKHVQRPGSQPHIGRDHTQSAGNGGPRLSQGLNAPGVFTLVLLVGGGRSGV